MMAGPLTLYLYYRVAESEQAAALPAAQALQAAVAADTQCTVALARRRDDTGTWMEIYAGVTDAEALQHSLQHHLAASPLARLIAGERHAEWFQPL